MNVGEEAPEGDGWKQDEDVLDTWFSPGPLAILNYGLADVDSEDFKRYYPNFNLGNRLRYHLFLVSRAWSSNHWNSQDANHLRMFLSNGLIRDEQGCKMPQISR